MPRTIPRSVIDTAGISGSGTVSSTAMIAALSIDLVATSATTAMLHPFERERDSLADADAHGGEAELAAGALELLCRGQREARARHAERVTERDCAAVGVHSAVVIGDAELAKDGEALRSERLVQFDHIEIRDFEAQPLHQLLAGGSGADAHDPRRNAGDRRAEDAGAGSQAIAFRRFLAGDDDRGGAVVDARGIAGGHRAVGADDRFQLRQGLERRL